MKVRVKLPLCVPLPWLLFQPGVAVVYEESGPSFRTFLIPGSPGVVRWRCCRGRLSCPIAMTAGVEWPLEPEDAVDLLTRGVPAFHRITLPYP